ncbi:hypothetical protein K439DRAFT_1615876 [Ramaria rubella]|nr:hypothetical protein K439DRAFT_1615876 [Ramaria rubella]
MRKASSINKRPMHFPSRINAGEQRESDAGNVSTRKRSHHDDTEDDGTSGSKRQGDDALFGWRHAHVPQLLTDEPIDPILERTLKLKWNYLLDSKGTKADLVGQRGCPEFPDNLWIDVLLDRFIDLDRVYTRAYSLTAEYKHTEKMGDLEIVVNSGGWGSAATKVVRTHGEWSIAFAKLKDTVLFAYPHRSKEFEDYERFIIRQFAALQETTLHLRVINLDWAIRLRVARSNRFLLTSFNNTSLPLPPAATLGQVPSKNRGGMLTLQHQFATDGMQGAVTQALVDSDTVVLPVEEDIVSEIVRKDKNVSVRSKSKDERWMRPRWTRGFLWSANTASPTPSASATETAQPLPGVPEDMLRSVPINQTINAHPNLFKIVTPINVEKYESLLNSHPNRSLVQSVCCGLRQGFWPFAEIGPDDPITFDLPHRKLDVQASEFIHMQRDIELAEGRYSESFGTDLLPGMYSPPIHVVPKPHSDKFRLINDHSAGPHALNSWISKVNGHICLDNLQDFGAILHRVLKEHGQPPAWLWKSDVSAAYLQMPASPYWQIKQIVTVDGQRHVDRCLVFGSRTSPRMWCTFFGLVIWITIYVRSIPDLLHYMDDMWSYDMDEKLIYYAPYDSFYPWKQVLSLHLWDDLNLPHSKDKQIFGHTLEIVSLLVNPSSMTITMVGERKDELVAAIRAFINTTVVRHRPLLEWQRLLGWINWALNVFPLLKPGLQLAYAKISGKSLSRAPIFINHAVIQDLGWVASVMEEADGVHMLESTEWTPGEADLHIFCDATLTHTLPFIALAVVSALAWASQLASPPHRLLIHSDSLNTIEMFHSLKALEGYNDLLLYAMRILLLSRISLRVAHISGKDNTVADALSCMLLDVVFSTPSGCVGSCAVMMHAATKSRQPQRVAWTHERLLRERAIALGHAIDLSTVQTYNSHLHSYLTFVKLHGFAVEPTIDILSFYIVYMSHHIKPQSVGSYLSGICNLLEPHFPNVHELRKHQLVVHTLNGMKKLRGAHPPARKWPISDSDLLCLLDHYASPSYDNLLFIMMLLTGFHALLRTAEFTQPESLSKQDSRKCVLWHSLSFQLDHFSFLLPYHKADRFFEGNIVMVHMRSPPHRLCPLVAMCSYATARDRLFPYHPELWLTSEGNMSTYSWFVSRLHAILDCDIGGHSIRSGGATALAPRRGP